MRILCVDDEELALQMLEMSIKKAKPDAEVVKKLYALYLRFPDVRGVQDAFFELFTESSETPDECGMSSVVTTPSNEKLYVNSFCFGYRFSNKELILSVYSGSPGEEFCKKNGLKHRVI